MAAETVRVKGLREFIRAADASGKETKKQVRDRLRKIAEPVRDTARSKLAPFSAHSAAGLGISVRRTGIVSVEQRRRKTTGQHPEFGVLQMRRVLIPSLFEHLEEIEREFDQALDDIARVFERG